MRTRAIAESDTLTRSAPASWSRRPASIVRSMRTLRGGSISTEMTNRPAASACPRREPRSCSIAATGPVSARAVRGVAPAMIEGEGVAEVGATALVGPSSATRIAAMWAGVVPQQPPMMRAPASSSLGTIEPNQGGSAA